MCGICGIVRPGAIVSNDQVRSMTGRLAHRGPDDEGFYFNKNAGFGFRRLSIIDLERGRQPMSNEDDSVWVVFNGEIYNFKELSDFLKAKGHIFKTSSDTEVILHGYEQWGLDFVRSIKGMFALALWDDRQRRLLLARDRIGIKPLYYAPGDGSLYFASEIKALLAAKSDIDTSIDLEALNFYLSLNYIPAPLTIFKGVRSLLPANLLIYEGAGVELREYWDIAHDTQTSVPLKEEEYIELLSLQLKKSVESHMISDVPVGAYLSGGLDSSAVVAFMSEIKKEPFKTFSIDFGEKSYSEGKYAQIVARHFKTEHHCRIVRPDIRAELLRIVACFDEPFADSSSIPLFFLSKLAAEHVKVVITGDGGDELFGGYQTYIADKLSCFYRKIPAGLRATLNGMVNKLPVSHKKLSLDMLAKRFVAGAHLPELLAHIYWRIIFNGEDRKKILTAGAATNFSDKDLEAFFSLYWEKAGHFKGVDKFCYFDTRAYLPNDMLVKVDRMTMANSLEARVPLLDSDLVQLAFRIPQSLKLRNFTTKYIFRKALKKRLPSVILNRKKAGFNVPMAQWINKDLKDMFRDVLLSGSDQYNGLINREHVLSMLNEHHRHKRDHSHQLYGLLVLSLWSENMK